MKRLLPLLFFIVVISLLNLSCEKSCTCKTYRNGVLTGEEVSNLPDDVNSCSDMNVYAETEDGVIRETKCN